MPFLCIIAPRCLEDFLCAKSCSAPIRKKGKNKKEEELNPAILYWLQVILIQYCWIAKTAWRQMVSVARKQRNLNSSCTHWKLALSSIKYIYISVSLALINKSKQEHVTDS